MMRETDPPTAIQVAIPPKLHDVFAGVAEVRGARGGRGSAKTRTFALMTAVRAYMWSAQGRSGVILCGRQYMNSLDESSMSEVKEAIRAESWLLPHFDIGEKYIRTIDKKIEFKFAGLERNIASVKSKARILLCWVDEAEPVSDKAWSTLIPTLREEDSELWVTWNPLRRTSATDKRFWQTKDPLFKVVEMNWRDNPRFPAILERKRLRDLANNPDEYDHIWEGAYATAMKGAYFTKQLSACLHEGRIGRLAPDPLLRLKAFADLGGTGRQADNFVFWIAQFVGKEVRVINHYEVQGQPVAAHLTWLHDNGYSPSNLDIWLPHDGVTNDRVFDVSFQSAFEAAKFTVEVVPNQGTGAAIARMNAARRMFPAVWFNNGPTNDKDDATLAGREALAYYHEKRDDERDIGLGPDHDWSSHTSDAYGLMAVVYEQLVRPVVKSPPRKRRFGSSAMSA